MCGISGIAFSSRSKKQINETVLRQMTDILHHRGPDADGIFIDGNIGLGHRRLSIVDVAHGAQPMFNDDRSSVIVYNGEVYNHADYRNELIAKGHKFQNRSDTETILHLYEEYGRDCVDYLRGMFAFAIWDKRKQELFIARDRFGVKPLYYVHTDDGSLYFASEIKALLETGAVKPEINFNALPDQLAGVADQDFQQVPLGRCEPDLLGAARPAHRPPRQVHDVLSDVGSWWLGGRPAATGDGPDAGE